MLVNSNKTRPEQIVKSKTLKCVIKKCLESLLETY